MPLAPIGAAAGACEPSTDLTSGAGEVSTVKEAPLSQHGELCGSQQPKKSEIGGKWPRVLGEVLSGSGRLCCLSRAAKIQDGTLP